MLTGLWRKWFITFNGANQLDSSNHHEADAKIVLITSQSSVPVVVVSTDTDVLIYLHMSMQHAKSQKNSKGKSVMRNMRV